MTRLGKFKYTAAPLAIGLALISTPSFAQDAEDEAEDAAPIVVTGSRIARPDVDGSSPVTVVGSEEIQSTGTTRVEDLINSLPQVLAGQNSFISNGASGTATVNLRGIGSERTLVLVNGRRMQPGDPSLPVADLNQIPAALIERVEVATGGASSVYGADAVAGVVNFIMDTDFEGVEFGTQYSFYQHKNRNSEIVDTVGGTNFTARDRMDQRGFQYPTGSVVDGQTWDSTLTIGGSLAEGRGHFVGYVGYRQVQPVLQGNRDHSSCALSRSSSDRVACGGSGTAPNATIADLAFGQEIFASATGADDFQPFTGAYNFAPVNYFQRPNKRWTAGFFGNYEISSSAEAYGEFMFMDSRTVAQIAQSGTFFNQYNISCDSPLLSAAMGATLCNALDTPQAVTDGLDTTAGDRNVSLLIGKRNVEGGPRRDDLRHTSYRAVVGLRGDVSDKWSYDVSGQYGTTAFAETYFNDLSSSRLTRALDATVDGSGNVVCSVNADANPANDDAACAPYNPFWGQGIVTDPRRGITQAAVGYVNTPGFQRGETQEWIASGYLTGKLGSLTAATPVSVVLGTEYRKVQIERSVDTAFATGDLAGQGGPIQNIAGEYSVKEVFGELLVPILEDVSFAESLSLELGYRYSDYSTVGTTHTYKVAGEWTPVSAVKLRGGYNRAVRAPNIVELFAPNVIGLWGGSDPCAGAAPSFTLAQCQNTGVAAAQYGTIASSPADQYNQIGGGNTGLNEETADTWTAGLVVDGRSFLPGLTVKVDYFNIKVRNAIQGIGAQTILNQCALTGGAQFCSLIQRAPVSGSLWVGQQGFITNTQQNIGGVKTDGVDIGVNYGAPLGSGRVSFDFNGTWLNSYVVDTGIASTGTDGRYDCVGLHGSVCGSPLPKWRHTSRVGYTFDSGVGLSLRWRHFAAVKTDGNNADLDLGGTIDPRSDIGSQNYFDLSSNLNIGDNLEMSFGVNNILDRDPPLVDGRFSSNANTYAEIYDPIGRYIFAGVNLRF